MHVWARLALWLVLSVVFSPALYAGEGESLSPGLRLAARVLAPTFDEGAIHSVAQAVAQKPQARQDKLPRRVSHVVALTPAAFAALLGAGWVAVVSGSHRSPAGIRSSGRRRVRAPPLVQPA